MLATLQKFLPPLDWGRRYTSDHLRGDLAAGLTTAVMLIPQGMAYAMLAGLPPIVGLYASVVPLVLYALLGTSRQLAVGPVAMVSLLVASGVGEIAQQGTEAYIAAAVVLALMVGVFQLVMGIGRLGFLTNFLSHPVLSGFTSAAALIIGLSQLKHLLGVNIPRSHHIHEILLNAARQAGDVNPWTLGLGLASIAALVLLKRWNKAFPRALAVVVAGTVAVWGLGLHEQGVAIVGDVPAGLPSPSLPAVSLSSLEALLPTALAISLVGFMESIAVARAFARRHRYEVDANQELIGLGAANLGAALFAGYPVTGGFSRTAVNDQAGARTPAAAIITAGVIALTLLFLTPLFHSLPKAVLAAIIMTAVAGLIDLHEVKHLWKVDRVDLAVLAVTFVATLSLGIEPGILAGVVTSLVVFLIQATRPHLAVLGRLPGTSVYRNVSRFPEAETTPGVLAVRVDAPFWFGNVTFLKDSLRRLEEEMTERLRAVVVDASSINRLDSSAAGALDEILDDYQRREVRFFLAGVKGPVRDMLDRTGLRKRIGPDQLTLRVDEAMTRARQYAAMHRAGEPVGEDAPTEEEPRGPSRGTDGEAPLSA